MPRASVIHGIRSAYRRPPRPRVTKTGLTLVAASCLIPMLAVAQSTTIRATAIRTAVTLDGRLDEPFWATADSIDDFRQREPLEGPPATERTVVKVARDAHALYVVVRCYDSNMRGVRAKPTPTRRRSVE